MPAEPILEAIGVAKTYGDGTEALAGVDLEVRAGETVALVGESGSGKTTLLRTFNRMIEPSAGAVRIEGRPAGELDAYLAASSERAGEAVAQASAVTARIRQERSTHKLGFGVPVRASLTLPDVYRDSWAVISGDVLLGNNVADVSVAFGGDDVVAAIEPAAHG